MEKSIFIAVFIFFGLTATAQDWCSWSFQYDFKMKDNKQGGYIFDRLEVSINDPFQSTRLENPSLIYNDSSSTYSLNLNYGCISCGYGSMHHPPTTYVEVYLFDKFRGQNIAIIIPLTFDTIKEPNTFIRQRPRHHNRNLPLLEQIVLFNTTSPVYFDFGTIRYEDFIFFNSNFVKYEGIRVKSDGTIHKYKKGEYLFPATEKLIKIKAVSKT